jgi:hypothetical protein
MTTETSDDATDGSATHVATGRLYHGTRDQLRPGDLIAPGGAASGGNGDSGSSFVSVSPDLDAAIWDAELAMGAAPPRVYVVETDGPIVDASELVAGKMLGHPSMSWRSSGEVRVESEVTEWTHYHGTRADLRPGDLLVPGNDPNFGRALSHVYLSRTLDAAIWAAELARGEGAERIYLVEPTGPIEDDPNVTDKKFRGNPTKSFRSRHPLRVTGELTKWEGHSRDAIAAMKAALENLKRQGVVPIDD